MRVTRILLLSAAALLAATSAFHATGLADAGSWLPGVRGAMIRVLWLSPLLAWGLVAVLWLLTALRPAAELKWVAVLAALVPAGTAVLMFAWLPFHPGAAMLLATAGLGAAGAATLRT